jgi:hypothetical protein
MHRMGSITFKRADPFTLGQPTSDQRPDGTYNTDKSKCSIYEICPQGWVVDAGNSKHYLNVNDQWWHSREIGLSFDDAIAGYGPFSTYFASKIEAEAALARASNPPSILNILPQGLASGARIVPQQPESPK